MSIVRDRPSGHIDTHTHVFSRDTAVFPLVADAPADGWFRAVACEDTDLLAGMDRAGVDRALLVQAYSAYGHDCRYILASARLHPGRLAAICSLDPAQPDAVQNWYTMRAEGARGVRIQVPFDSSLLALPFWHVLREDPVPICLVGGENVSNVALQLASIVPGPIVLDHCAIPLRPDYHGGVPAELLELIEQPNIHLKITTPILRGDGLAPTDPYEFTARLVERIPTRLVWGTDFSHTQDRPYDELVDEAVAFFAVLGDDLSSAVMRDNAERLWWPPRSSDASSS